MSIPSEIPGPPTAGKTPPKPVESRISKKQFLLIAAIVAVLVGAFTYFVFFYGMPNWVTVASWNGRDTEFKLTTEPFTINGTDWHINWQAAGYDSSARCYVSVYDATTNGLITALPHDQSGLIDFNTKGTFYLKIETHGAITSWSVQVLQSP
jgi:hypothetical protein